MIAVLLMHNTALWETCCLCMSRFQRAHGDHAMTAMALDAQHRRLVTGADNGVLKVWNFSSGACLKEMISLCSKDITGMASNSMLPATDAARMQLCFQQQPF